MEKSKAAAPVIRFDHSLSSRPHVVRRYKSLVPEWAIRAFRPPTTTHLQVVASPPSGEVAVGFAGHSTALLRYHDAGILFDPMLGNWCHGVRRESTAGMAPPAKVNTILISQASAGHLHIPTLKKLPREATIIVPRGVARKLSKLRFARVVELQPGSTVDTENARITAVGTHPSSERVVNFLVEGEGPSVFLCGASGYFHGFKQIGHLYQPDIAFLPIGGYSPKSFRERHLTPPQALQAFADLRARAFIPHHFGAFPLSYEHLLDPEVWLAKAAFDQGLQRYVFVLGPGESRTFTMPAAHLGRIDRRHQLRRSLAS